jgi:glycosyltransferase 2 family protein
VTRRFAIKLALSLGVGAICVPFALSGLDTHGVLDGLRALPPRAIVLYLATLALTHLFRAWRWEYLLRPLGVSLPLWRLLLISSAGFMAILALPVRLGEFVRPYFVTRERPLRMSAALGTVAVERIIDGLMISIVFFVAYLVSASDSFPRELRVGAWLSLLGFVGLTTFLALARVWPERTIAFALRASLLERFAPRRALQVGDKLRAVISGFDALADHRNFGVFLLQSVVYWGINGFGMWILARQMDLPISLGAAFTTMAITGVALTLPNAPGLLGQFHLAIKVGLLAYLPAAVVNSRGMAYAIVLHGVQTIWYIGVGLLSLAALSTGGRHASLGEAVRESNRVVEDAAGGI